MTVQMLDDLPGHLIRRLHQIAVSAFAAQLEVAGSDLTPVQYAALHTLAQNPGVDQATLAGMIAYDKVTIGGVLSRLEARGLVARGVSITDRRSRILQITPLGEQTLDQISEPVLKAQGDMLRGLSKVETETFMRLLRKATDAGNALSRAPLRLSEPTPA
jgi:MarR family transcriptional regulator, temperature-dependent positive regulator of motility